MSTGALVLSGGSARRMGGQPKALLTLNGETFLQRLAHTFDAFEEKLLSTNEPSSAKETPFHPVADQFPGKGPLAGLHAALSICKSNALVVCPCDTPLFPAALAHWLVAERKRWGVAALALTDRGGRAYPLCGVYTKDCLPALDEALRGNHLRVMPLFDAVGGVFLSLAGTPFPDEVLTNVNTPVELAGLKSN